MFVHHRYFSQQVPRLVALAVTALLITAVVPAPAIAQQDPGTAAGQAIFCTCMECAGLSPERRCDFENLPFDGFDTFWPPINPGKKSADVLRQ